MYLPASYSPHAGWLALNRGALHSKPERAIAPRACAVCQLPPQSWRALVLTGMGCDVTALQVALCTLGIVICYADRSNISTAVLPMAQQFGWDKVGG